MAYVIFISCFEDYSKFSFLRNDVFSETSEYFTLIDAYEFCKESENLNNAINLIPSTPPNSVIVLALNHGEQRKNIEFIQKVKNAAEDKKLVVIADRLCLKECVLYSKFGADGYLSFPVSPFEIKDLIFTAIPKLDLHKSDIESGLIRRDNTNFLARTSHEIRTPITSIIGQSELCLDSSTTDKEKQSALKSISRNGNYLLGIIDNILDYSQLETGEVDVNNSTINLVEMLNDVVSLHIRKASKNNSIITLDYRFPIPKFIETDVTSVKQILVNLLGNAVKFTKNGEIKITTAISDDNQDIEFSVKDTGTGIPANKLKKIFEPFFQVNEASLNLNIEPQAHSSNKGVGLGLAISKKLTKTLGGEISVKSKLDQGTEFSIKIPTNILTSPETYNSLEEIKDYSSINASASEDNLEVPKLKGHVLIVEDVVDNSQFIAFYLRKAGLTFDIAQDGLEAIDLVTQNSYDLILMDVHMPNLDGTKAMKAIRDGGYKGYIITTSADSMESSKQNSKKNGSDEYLTKPFSRESFFKVLSKYLPKDVSIPLEKQVEMIRTQPSFINLVDKFKTKIPDRINTIKDALARNDIKEVSDSAHRLASAKMFGFAEISEIAKSIEVSASSKNIKKLNELIIELENISKALH